MHQDDGGCCVDFGGSGRLTGGGGGIAVGRDLETDCTPAAASPESARCTRSVVNDVCCCTLGVSVLAPMEGVDATARCAVPAGAAAAGDEDLDESGESFFDSSDDSSCGNGSLGTAPAVCAGVDDGTAAAAEAAAAAVTAGRWRTASSTNELENSILAAY